MIATPPPKLPPKPPPFPGEQWEESKLPPPPPPAAHVVSELRHMLGPAVMLKCEGKKPVGKEWQVTRLDDMTTEHLAGLPKGNIGVLLGAASGGLCVLDCDDDDFAQQLLDCNPALADTFRTRGARGCSFWIRCSDAYPDTRKLQSVDGTEVGEFRSNRSHSVCWGLHPEGNRYRWLVAKPVLSIAFGSIQWPASLSPDTIKRLGILFRQDPSGQLPSGSCLKAVAYVTVESEGGSGGAVMSPSGLSGETKLELGRAVELGALSTRQNNSAAFKAALALLEIRNAENLKSMPPAEQDYFADAWFAKLCSLGRTHKAKAHYLADIYSSIQRAERFAIMNSNDTVQKAWANAQTSPLPPEAARFDGDIITQNLIALGWQLHLLNEGRQWPLGRDKAGNVMRLTDSQIRHDLDDSFKVVIGRIFKIARPWDKAKHLATEYIYIAQQSSDKGQ